MHLSHCFLVYAAIAIPLAAQLAVGLLNENRAVQGHSDTKKTIRRRGSPPPAPGPPGTFTGPNDFGGQVRWEDMTSKDGTKSGSDSDKIWYLKEFINHYLKEVKPEFRNGVFWSGGATSEEDIAAIEEFIDSPTRLGGKGVIANMVYKMDIFQGMGLDGSKTNLWWRATNRMSKALSASCAGAGIAYVYLNPVNHRTIFSPPSQNPKDEDPDHNNQATNGEIWYYAELPMLMRNQNIHTIISFWKSGIKFVTKVEWDAKKDSHTYPRSKFDDIAMDASPIVLPPEAGRPPLKTGEEMHGIW